jgi:hypothetical protein
MQNCVDNKSRGFHFVVHGKESALVMRVAYCLRIAGTAEATGKLDQVFRQTPCTSQIPTGRDFDTSRLLREDPAPLEV